MLFLCEYYLVRSTDNKTNCSTETVFADPEPGTSNPETQNQMNNEY